MKICPFISHMMGEERTNVLEIDMETSNDSGAGDADRKSKKDGDVVILGYDGESDGGVAVKSPPKSKAKAKAKTGAKTQSHLFCLKDTCRFYVKKTGDCKFDTIFEMVDAQAKAAATKKPDNTATKAVQDSTNKVTKELDKFWKFQTKSVSELISSIGDTEKKQEKNISGLKSGFEEKLKELAKSQGDSKELDAIKGEISKLQQTLESREDGMENFSTTVSEIVMNVEDGLKEIKGQSGDLAKRIEKLEVAMPKLDSIQKHVAKTIEKSIDGVKQPDVSGDVKAMADHLREMEKAIQKGIDGVKPPDVSSDFIAMSDRLRAMEKSIEKRIDGVKQPDVSFDVKSMSDRLREVFDANEKFENQLRSWQDKLDSRVDDIHKSQQAWSDRLDELSKNQTQVLEAVESKRDTQEDEKAQRRRREAKKLNNLGVTSFHNGDLELARDQFVDAVSFDGEFAESYNNLGLVYTELGEEEKATEAFGIAIKLNPDLHAAYNNLGYVFYKQGSYDQAIEMYNEALGRTSNNSSAYTNLGNAYYKLGQQEDARTAWEKALELDPGNEKASRNLKRIDRE